MPWILSNYTSEELDLDNLENYRNLLLPVGALNPDRLRMLQEERIVIPDNDMNHLYGSLYSSSAVVISWLIRIEPFTSMHIKLQSGKFDHPDRLFVSIPEAWTSCVSRQADYRELIPEFFLFPDFLVNSDKFDLGKLWTGETVGDVILPPWSRTPSEFIEFHRAALESPQVSSHLHLWIDLVFGPNSRTPLNDKHFNTYNKYFYDSVLTREVLNNPIETKVVKEFTACFGAVPAQIFDGHPPARVFSPGPCICAPQRAIDIDDSVSALLWNKRGLFAFTYHGQFHMYHDAEEYYRGDFAFPRPGIHQSPVVSCSSRLIVTTLPCFPYFFGFDVKNGHVTPKFKCTHNKPVTCLAVFQNCIVSAARDLTLRVWQIADTTKYTRIQVPQAAPIAFLRIRTLFREVVSLSHNGFLAVSSLDECRYLRGVQLRASHPSEMVVSDLGFIAVAFNMPDSLTIVVLGQNLGVAGERQFDGALGSWTTAVVNGIDHLLIYLSNKKLMLAMLPTLNVIVLDEHVGSTVTAMAFAKTESCAYFATSEKKIYKWPIGWAVKG
jgi:hypothetical protein